MTRTLFQMLCVIVGLASALLSVGSAINGNITTMMISFVAFGCCLVGFLLAAKNH